VSSSTFKLFLASFLSLFFELLFIRWLPDAIHVFSFFGNFVLLSCFLGLGLGLARPLGPKDTDDRLLARFWGLSGLLIVLGAIFLWFQIDVPPPNQGIFLNDDAFIQGPKPLHVNLYVTISLFSGLIALTFVPLGQLLSRYFEAHPPLYGYTVNILASLAGIGAFALLSFLCTPPGVWMVVGFGLLALFARRRALALGLALAVGIGLHLFERQLEVKQGYVKSWSPYYNIRLFTLGNGDKHIFIGNSCLLTAIDLSPEAKNEIHRTFYKFPYRFMPHPRRVLVLGGGMGNDVAMALLEGAEHVDAVEIDPLVWRIGRDHHPLHPYKDPRVTVINTDARNFLSKTKERYDLIIFATLDSHGLFSQMASIKMENYVYTRECFAQAKKLLTDRGVMYLNVGFMGKFVPARLYLTLTSVFGKEPEFYFYRNLYSMFVCGAVDPSISADDPAAGLNRIKLNLQAVAASAPGAAELPTDDWPQLYLAKRAVPMEYVYALGILLVVSVVLLWLGLPRQGAFRFDWHFFFLGSGFMLLETKSITELGLMFGSTWMVNSVVISSILTMIFLANVFLLKRGRPLNVTPVYGVLWLLLIGLFAFPVREWSLGGGPALQLTAVVAIFLPLLMAAMIFGSSFAQTPHPAQTLASNMLGAMVGGALEYSSMAFGLRSLYLTALALYLLSWVGRRLPGAK